MSTRFIQLGKVAVVFDHEYESKHVISKKTGLTTVGSFPKATKIKMDTGSEVIETRVSCSYKDHFTYEKGRKTALKKAFSLVTNKSNLDKIDRKRVWDEYNKLKPGGRW
jgi:hypothetical protein